MKTLLATWFLTLGILSLRAEPLVLSLDVYRFEAEPGLLSEISSEAQLRLLADKQPVASQRLGIQPDFGTRTETHLGSFTLKVDALAKPAGDEIFALVINFILTEQVVVGSASVPSTFAANTKLTLPLRQRWVLNSTHTSVDNGMTRYQLVVVSLEM